MSDKPLVQEELTEDLGSLIHCFADPKVGIQFFQNFLETMCLEWFGIDQWRIDKFMMVSILVHAMMRRILNLNFSISQSSARSSRLPSDALRPQERQVGG